MCCCRDLALRGSLLLSLVKRMTKYCCTRQMLNALLRVGMCLFRVHVQQLLSRAPVILLVEEAYFLSLMERKATYRCTSQILNESACFELFVPSLCSVRLTLLLSRFSSPDSRREKSIPALSAARNHQVCCCPMFFFWDVYDDISHPGGVPMRHFSVSWQVGAASPRHSG